MINKLDKLRAFLKTLKRVIIAYSGGVDSSFLLKIAIDSLGAKNVLAVTAISETYTSSEKHNAIQTAKEIGARLKIIKTSEFSDKNFIKNPANRCYFCKKELFSKLRKIAIKNRYNFILDGSNADDIFDFRPGVRAKKEFKILSPLHDMGITKTEIRQFSKKLKLKTWNKPAYACLASRIPYGTKITKEKLDRINKAEKLLRNLKFKQLRVRDHGDIARIEIEKKDFLSFFYRHPFTNIIYKFKLLGYKHVTFDLEGYQAGSMNKALKL